MAEPPAPAPWTLPPARWPWQRSLQRRILFTYGAVFAAVILVLMAAVGRVVYQAAVEEAHHSLEVEAFLAANALEDPNSGYLAEFEAFDRWEGEHSGDDDDEQDNKEDPTNKKDAKKKGKDLYCRDYDSDKSPHIVFIIDSLPAFSEQEDIVEDQGRRAKKWHAVLRRVTGFLDAKIMVLFSNHVIYKPGMFGGKTKTSGLSPDYYRDCGIELHLLSELKDASGVVIGSMIHARVDKTRRGASGAETYFPIYFKDGAPRFSGIMPYAEYLGLAEITNAKAFKEGKWQVWANYAVKGVTGKISEQDPAVLEAFVRANNILPMIGAREKELIK